MVEKRGHEQDGAGDGSPAKKARIEEGAKPAVAKPGLSLEALEKAKKALQLQKELKEKLKNLPQVGRSPAITRENSPASIAACAESSPSRFARSSRSRQLLQLELGRHQVGWGMHAAMHTLCAGVCVCCAVLCQYVSVHVAAT